MYCCMLSLDSTILQGWGMGSIAILGGLSFILLRSILAALENTFEVIDSRTWPDKLTPVHRLISSSQTIL